RQSMMEHAVRTDRLTTLVKRSDLLPAHQPRNGRRMRPGIVWKNLRSDQTRPFFGRSINQSGTDEKDRSNSPRKQNGLCKLIVRLKAIIERQQARAVATGRRRAFAGKDRLRFARGEKSVFS